MAVRSSAPDLSYLLLLVLTPLFFVGNASAA